MLSAIAICAGRQLGEDIHLLGVWLHLHPKLQILWPTAFGEKSLQPDLGVRPCGRGLSYQCVVRDGSKAQYPVDHIKIAGIHGCSSPYPRKIPIVVGISPCFGFDSCPWPDGNTRLFRHRSRQSKLSSCVVAGVAEAPGNGNGSPRKMGHFSLRKRLDLVICRGTQTGDEKTLKILIWINMDDI